jgi:hypothetical protein
MLNVRDRRRVLLLLLNIYCYYGAGVQVGDRQPYVQRVIRLTMYQHVTTGLSNRGL